MKVEEYVKTFSTFAGADIAVSFNGRVMGEIQAISYSIAREVSPVYTMASADPRSFSKGKRGIQGDLVFIQFDRDALLEEMKKEYVSGKPRALYQTFVANGNGAGLNGSQGLQDQILNGLKSTRGGYGVETWDEQMTKLGFGSTGEFDDNRLTDFFVPEYADQLMPFNSTITMANESGARAGMEIHGIQLMSEGGGYSVDDVVAAKAYKYVARKIKPVTSKGGLAQTGKASMSAVMDDRQIVSSV